MVDFETRWWTRLSGGRLRCELCPRYCELKPEQRGFCFVRKAANKGIELTTYGRSSGFCIDPIEKKPLNHFLPGTSVLSFGTAGCNMGCFFCQNWDISKSRQDDRLQKVALPSDIATTAQRHGCASVAFTYNDPVIFAEYAIDTAWECQKRGIHAVAVTNGYITEKAREDFFKPLSAANIDLKAFRPSFYKKVCLSEFEPVLATLEYVRHKTKVWLEITTLLIPGENDSDEEISQLSRWVLEHLGKDVPLHFTAFHPDYRMQAKPRTPSQTVLKAREIAMEIGLQYVYTGNITAPEGSCTRCPKCGKDLIQRSGYEITQYSMNQSQCPGCKSVVSGKFQDHPGDCGNKRMVVEVT